MAYEFHRIFCGAPLEVEPEREAFYAAMTDVNENEAMKQGILLVSLSLVPNVASLAAFQGAIDENIRSCRHYIQILGDTWGPPMRSFEGSFELARRCAADPALPMREVALMWKASDQPLQGKLKKLKEDPPGGVRIFEFEDTGSFQKQVRDLLIEWLRGLLAEKGNPENPPVIRPES